MTFTQMQGVRFRAYPTPQMAQTLSQWIGCARVIYNCKVHEDREAFKSGQQLPVTQQYSHFKTEDRAWLKEAPSQVLRNSAYRFKEAYQRFFKGLAQRPNFKKKGQRDSVWLTKELFRFIDGKLILGTRKHPIGELPVHAHRPYGHPASITISKRADHWFVSFTYEQEIAEPLRTKEELAYELQGLGEEALQQLTWGGDRGVAIPVAGSDGQNFGFTTEHLTGLARAERRRRKYQKRLARQVKGSNRRQRTKRQIGRTHQYQANVRQDFAHKTSHTLAESHYRLFVGEELKIRNMVRRPRAKPDANGQWLRNGAKAKAGLNRAILASAWGQTLRYLEYKAQRRGKLLIAVPPHHSSQECSVCGHTHPDNRRSQAGFVCQGCGYQANADFNASRVIQQRGVKLLLAGEIRLAARKKVGIRRKESVGVELPEITHGEIDVRPAAVTAAPAGSLNREEAPSIAA